MHWHKIHLLFLLSFDTPRIFAGFLKKYKEQNVCWMSNNALNASVWAAKAGAQKVYGIEATKVAQNARLLAKCNGVEDVVEIIQSEMEKVEPWPWLLETLRFFGWCGSHCPSGA